MEEIEFLLLLVFELVTIPARNNTHDSEVSAGAEESDQVDSSLTSLNGFGLVIIVVTDVVVVVVNPDVDAVVVMTGVEPVVSGLVNVVVVDSTVGVAVCLVNVEVVDLDVEATCCLNLNWSRRLPCQR